MKDPSPSTKDPRTAFVGMGLSAGYQSSSVRTQALLLWIQAQMSGHWTWVQGFRPGLNGPRHGRWGPGPSRQRPGPKRRDLGTNVRFSMSKCGVSGPSTDI